VAVVLIIGALLMYRRTQNKNREKSKAAKTRQKGERTTASHANPTYEHGHPGAAQPVRTGPPPWADPNVPFLSRGDAASQLAARGNVDGDFIARQSDKLPSGYIVTSVCKGVIANSQLKLTNGQLMYGRMALGSNLSQAISALQTRVQISPATGQPYNLKGAIAQAQPGYLDVTGAGNDDDDADA
jgi:hypothetical protein